MWQDNFKEGREIVLATCYGNKPNANIVISLGFVDNKLLVADCQMKNTISNLTKNKKICIVGGYFRLVGDVKIFNSGKYFDVAAKKSPDYKVRHAILMTIREVFDLDKQKKLAI